MFTRWPLLLSVLLLLATVSAALVQVSSPRHLATFSTLPILHEGRIMPMDTFARRALLTLSGKQTINNISASAWLEKTLRHPETQYDKPLLHLPNRALVQSLGLTTRKGSRFTFTEIATALAANSALITAAKSTPEEHLSAEQMALVELTYKHSFFFDISRSLTIFTPESQMSLDGSSGSLRVIPSAPNNPLMAWQSPWQTAQGQTEPPAFQHSLMAAWQEFATAQNPADAMQKIHDLTVGYANISLLKLEVIYHALDPIKVSLVFYLTAFLLALMPFAQKSLPILALNASLLAGLWLHILALAARIALTGRPPIATLYESIITTSLIAAIGFIFLFKNRPQTAAILAGGTATLLHFVSFKFAYTSDSFGVLVAVLNTNFWLATHVTSMIIGYGLSFMASMLGGWYLLERVRGRSAEVSLPILNITISTMLFALLFSTLGTVLGGIWADQSWGRFWGWDPKENGALLLVLWLCFLLHARFKTIGSITFAAGALMTTIVLALAWFGVNLLGVGLHSYGFTSGIAWKLIAFCSLMTGISVVLWAVAAWRGARR